MNLLSWSSVRNKPNQCAEFAACHENFAWRKHHSSRFGLLKGNSRGCASDSLSRAFNSERDSILLLFADGNRTLNKHPEYGRPLFAAVWYEDEDWAILCNKNQAALILSDLVSGFKREKEGAATKLHFLQNIWNQTPDNIKIPINQVYNHIA